MIDRLGWTLLHFVWEGALIALALAFVLPFVRRSARARYALACLALGLLVAAPVATYRALAPAASFAAAPSRLVSTPRQAILAEGTPYQSMLPVLVAVWALGVAVLSVRLGARLYGIERWRRRHARPVGPEWQARVDDLARGMGIQRAIRVLVSDRIAVPSAWGVLRAVIVLPSSLLAGLSTAQVETILLHELAHIRRHDYLVNLVQAVVETLLFYHPAVWWVSGVVRREREHCCDDAVVARLPDPMPYARALLHLEERRHGLPRPTLSAKEGNLMNRIARILTPQPAPTRVSPLASLLAALGVLGAILGGTLQAQAQSKPHSAPKKKPAVAAKPARSAKPLKAVRPVVAAIAPLAPVAPLAAIAPVAPPAPYRWSVSKANGGRLAPLAPPAPAFVQGRRGPGVPPPASAPVRALPMPPLPPPALSGISKGESIAFAAPLPAPAQGGLGGGSFGGGSFRGQSGGLGGGSAQGFGGGGFGGGGFGGGSTAATAPTSPVYGGLSGGGHGRNGPEEAQVESGPPGTVSVDAKEASLVLVMRRMARAAKLSVVIEAGDYREVTMVLTDLPTAEAMGILCRAANATFRKEGNVYYVSPRG